MCPHYVSARCLCLQVRYERRAGADTILKVMTDGILLRELQARPKAPVLCKVPLPVRHSAQAGF